MADFFISYNNADSDWAEWIAWTLQEAGFEVIIQSWHFRPGSNFVVEMQRALDQSDRLILVMSVHSLRAAFPQAEWAAAFANDPTGNIRKLVPVKVEDCEPTGLLAQIVHIDLVGLSPEDAVQTLLDGLNPSPAIPGTAPQFPGKSSPVMDIGAPVALPGGLSSIESRIQLARQATALDGYPTYILSAHPSRPVAVTDLFESSNAPVVRLLEDPPEIRPSGFDLYSGSSSRIVQGNLRRAILDGRETCLDLWRDGTLVFVAPGDMRYLQYTGTPPVPYRMNQVVLIESVYLFCLLWDELQAHMQPHPRSVTLRLDLLDLDSGGQLPGLPAGPPTSRLRWSRSLNTAPEPHGTFTVTWEGENFDVGKYAYRLVSEVYIWFGIELQRIPFTVGEGEDRAIDPTPIIQLRG